MDVHPLSQSCIRYCTEYRTRNDRFRTIFITYDDNHETMIACESCDDDVEQVVRHREYGVAPTHRVTRWLCRACHPTLPDETASPGVETVVADGGTVACPNCASSTVNVHGIQNCPACLWTSH